VWREKGHEQGGWSRSAGDSACDAASARLAAGMGQRRGARGPTREEMKWVEPGMNSNIWDLFKSISN
jgi:hypothetical protein